MKNTTIRTLVSGLLLGTVTSCAHASGALTSPIDDDSFGAAGEWGILLQTFTDSKRINEQ